MISIFDHIQYLLCHHDCVVVEGFGAFVACRRAAYISSDGCRFVPPGRDLGFNKVLVHDDGLLAGSIARRNGVNYDSAKAVVERDVELMHNTLHSDGVLAIPRVGTFVLNESGAMEFKPESGLESIVDSRYRLLPEITVEGIPVSRDAVKPNILEVKPRTAATRMVSALKYAASVALLFGIGFTVSTPLVVDRGDVDFASLAIPSVTKPAVTFLYDDSADAGRSLFIKKPVAEETQKTLTTVAGEREYGFYLIVGSCASRREANRFIARQGDPRMRIVKGDGRYRIYVAAGDSYEEAAELRTNDKDFVAKHPDAWIYQRNK